MQQRNIFLTINQDTKEKELRFDNNTASIFENYRYEELELDNDTKITWGVKAKNGVMLLAVAILEHIYSYEFAIEYYDTFVKYLKSIPARDEADFNGIEIDTWLKMNIPNFQTISILLPNKSKKTFTKHIDLREWLDSNEAEYQRILSANHTVLQTYNNFFNEITRQFFNIEDPNIFCDNPQLKTLADNIQEVLSRMNFIDYNDPKFLEADKYYEKNKELACYVLTYFLGMANQINPSDVNVLKGYFIALQYENGIKSNIENEKSELEKVKASYSQTQEELIEILDSYKVEYDNNDTILESKISEFEVDFQEFMDESQSSYDKAKQFYETEVQLKAPADYWEKRWKSHKAKAIWIGTIFMVIGGSLLAYLLKGVDYTHYEFSNAIKVVITSTASIVLLKILHKLFFSNYHLYITAQERVVMMKSYLSMVRDGTLDNTEDKQYILEALFKHSSDGIINDTDLSLPLHDIAKAIKKP